MAASPLNPKAPYHARSISLPSKSHPLTLRVEEQLYRLRTSEATFSSSSSSICHNLGGLRELYDCVDDLLQLPLAQQTFAHERHEKWVDEASDGSLRLLDVCGTARDILLNMKEQVQAIQSSLRRRRGAELDLGNEIGTYLTSRRKEKKAVQKCLGDLKNMENKRAFSSPLDKDHEVVAMVSVLRQVEAITLSVLESLLSFVSGRKGRSKPSGWSLVSKLMNTKRVACHEGEEADFSEVEKVDAALSALSSRRLGKNITVQNVRTQLEALELSIQGLEDGLESVFRNIIRSRVTLLNILNH